MSLPAGHPLLQGGAAASLCALFTAEPSLVFATELKPLRDALNIAGCKVPKGVYTPKAAGDGDTPMPAAEAEKLPEGLSRVAAPTDPAEKARKEDEALAKLHAEQDLKDPEPALLPVDEGLIPKDSEPFEAVPEGEGKGDFEAAGDAKMKAGECKNNGDYAGALAGYTEAMALGGASALTLANRADVLLKLKRPMAAIADCNAALAKNPDSCKALKVRGKCHRKVGMYTEANKDLSASLGMDFDPDIDELRKTEVAPRLQNVQSRAAWKLNWEKKMKKREFDAKKKAIAREKTEKARQSRLNPKHMRGTPAAAASAPAAAPAAAPAPGAGAGGADPMMAGLMQMLQSDPELAAMMGKPKVMMAMQKIMSNPSLMANPTAMMADPMMADPEVMAFMGKLSAKLGPMMGAAGGMPGMPGGMGGMPGMGGMGGGMGGMGGGPGPSVDEVD